MVWGHVKSHMTIIRERPLMIWQGGRLEIEKKKLGGPSPGNKLRKASSREKMERPSPGKKIQKGLLQEKEINDFCSEKKKIKHLIGFDKEKKFQSHQIFLKGLSREKNQKGLPQEKKFEKASLRKKQFQKGLLQEKNLERLSLSGIKMDFWKKA